MNDEFSSSPATGETGFDFDRGNYTKHLIQVLCVFLAVLLGGVGGSFLTQYALGRDVARLSGQVTELLKIGERVAANEARIGELDFAIRELEGPAIKPWRRPR